MPMDIIVMFYCWLWPTEFSGEFAYLVFCWNSLELTSLFLTRDFSIVLAKPKQPAIIQTVISVYQKKKMDTVDGAVLKIYHESQVPVIIQGLDKSSLP